MKDTKSGKLLKGMLSIGVHMSTLDRDHLILPEQAAGANSSASDTRSAVWPL
jgi:hypothetical protein